MNPNVSKNMNLKKKHHYIPIFMLNFFKKKKSKKVSYFDKIQQLHRAQRPEKIACQNYLYRFKKKGKVTERCLEDYTAGIDDKAANVIAQIISNSSVAGLNESQRIALVKFIVLSKYRTPYNIKIEERLIETFKRELSPNVSVPYLNNKTVSEVTNDDIVNRFLEKLKKNIEKYYPALVNRAIHLIEAPKKCSFVISDNPVIEVNCDQYCDMIDERLEASNLGDLLMPISPQYYVAIQNSNNRRIQITDGINEKQAINAERFIYANSERHLKIVGGKQILQPHIKLAPNVKEIFRNC